MIATGFLRVGPNLGGGERGRQDALDDLVATTSLTFMGMTVGCARCHNHKFDPIPQKDYYRMQAVFFSTRGLDIPLVPAHEVEANTKAETAHIDGLIARCGRPRKRIEAPYLKRLVDQEIARLPEYLQVAYKTPAAQRTEGQKLNAAQVEKTLQNDTLRAKITEKDLVPLMTAEEQAEAPQLRRRRSRRSSRRSRSRIQRPWPSATRAARRARRSSCTAAASTRGSQMTPGVLSVATTVDDQFPAPPPDAKSTYRRRGLAEWLVVARQPVDRARHGQPDLAAPFRRRHRPHAQQLRQDGRACHPIPELLDWLAVEFVERGWSIKAMHRLMMTSEAYQMASGDIAANLAIDPENRMFWRMPRQRLEGEIIRDQVLAVAGTLDRTLGGPNVFPYIDPDLFEKSSKRDWPGKPDEDPSTWRRSLYVFSKRSIRYPLFETFDQPNLVNSVDRRNRSTVAGAGTALMNNAFDACCRREVRRAARARSRRRSGGAGQTRIPLALGREPDADELARSIAFVTPGPRGLAEFCQVLFNLNEFVYRP